MQHLPGSTSLLILEQCSNQLIRFEFTLYVKFRLTTMGYVLLHQSVEEFTVKTRGPGMVNEASMVNELLSTIIHLTQVTKLRSFRLNEYDWLRHR